jgi:hypothetical protein
MRRHRRRSPRFTGGARRLGRATAVVALSLVAACTFSADATTTTAAPTTTLAPVDAAAVLDAVTHPEYAAVVTIDERYSFRRGARPSGEAVVTGGGRYVGGELDVSIEVAVSGLTAAAAETLGIPSSRDVKVTSGAMFTRTDGGHWIIGSGPAYSRSEDAVWIGPQAPWTVEWAGTWFGANHPSSESAVADTAMGHVLKAVAGATATGEPEAGAGVWRLPLEEIEVDPVYLGLRGWISDFESTVWLEASPGGIPSGVVVAASWSQGRADPVDVEFTARYGLEATDPAPILQPPRYHRTFTSSRDRFSIVIPIYWAISYFPDGGFVFEDTPFVWIDVYTTHEPVVGGQRFDSLEEAAELLPVLLAADLPDEVRFDDVSPAAIDGIPASSFPIAFELEGREYQGAALVALDDEFLVVVAWYQTARGGLDEIRDVLAGLDILPPLEGSPPPDTPRTITLAGTDHTVTAGPVDPYRLDLADDYLEGVAEWLEGAPPKEILENAFYACRVLDAEPAVGSFRGDALRGLLAEADEELVTSVGLAIATFCPWLVTVWTEEFGD